MLRRHLMTAALAVAASLGAAHAAEVVDATGRTVAIPDRITRVMPAGAPAAVLLSALAPDLMIGWPHRPGESAAAFLPSGVMALPEIPSLTGRQDVVASVKQLEPDLVLDYGDTDPRYIALAKKVQDVSGVPTLLLDGKLSLTPLALRVLGRTLHREARAEELARFAEGVLASAGSRRSATTVVLVRGATGKEVATPGTGSSEAIEFLGWTVLAPVRPAAGSSDDVPNYQPATVQQIASLDPDIVLFANPAMAEVVRSDTSWAGLRAVRDHHAWVVPMLPFGWLDGPPSLNRLLGIAWLSGGQSDLGAVPFTAVFHAVVYGRTPTPSQIRSLRTALAPVTP